MSHDLPSHRDSDSERQGTYLQGPGPARAGTRRLPIVLAGGVLILLAAVMLALVPRLASSSTRASAPTATPQPRVLYQANWGQGADGWTLPAHWSLSHGQVEN